MKKALCALALPLMMLSCINDHVDDAHDHLEPYGLLLVQGTDTLKFYNADADHGIAQRSDTIRLMQGTSANYKVLLATEQGPVVPDTSDADHQLALKSIADSSVSLKVTQWNVQMKPSRSVKAQAELQILHGGHVDFVLAQPIQIEVK